MGYYINHNSKGEPLGRNKVHDLIQDGAKLTSATFQPNLICVVNNGSFQAAAYCYNEDEFKQCKRQDGRIKTWLTHDLAKTLSDYKDPQ